MQWGALGDVGYPEQRCEEALALWGPLGDPGAEGGGGPASPRPGARTPRPRRFGTQSSGELLRSWRSPWAPAACGGSGLLPQRGAGLPGAAETSGLRGCGRPVHVRPMLGSCPGGVGKAQGTQPAGGPWSPWQNAGFQIGRWRLHSVPMDFSEHSAGWPGCTLPAGFAVSGPQPGWGPGCRVGFSSNASWRYVFGVILNLFFCVSQWG